MIPQKLIWAMRFLAVVTLGLQIALLAMGGFNGGSSVAITWIVIFLIWSPFYRKEGEW